MFTGLYQRDLRTDSAGSWTPVLTFATPGNLAVTYTAQVGRYVRLGSLALVWFTIHTSAFTHTTASGNCRITGLPITPASVTGLHFQGGMQWSGITKAGYTQWLPQSVLGNSYLEFTGSGSGQATDSLDTADMPTGGTVILRGFIAYLVA